MYEDNNHSELEQENMDCNESEHERRLKIINELIDYHLEMLGFLENKKNNIEKKGPSTFIEPKKPTSRIPMLNQSKSNRLIGYELHEYLKKYITST